MPDMVRLHEVRSWQGQEEEGPSDGSVEPTAALVDLTYPQHEYYDIWSMHLPIVLDATRSKK